MQACAQRGVQCRCHDDSVANKRFNRVEDHRHRQKLLLLPDSVFRKGQIALPGVQEWSFPSAATGAPCLRGRFLGPSASVQHEVRMWQSKRLAKEPIT